MTDRRDALHAAIEDLARLAASRHGVEVVEVVIRRQGKHSLIRVDIDRAGLPGVGLGDCEAVSRELEPGLDALDPMGDPYELQVSSPGLDRPIRTSDDVRRNTGRRVIVEAREPIEGSRVFRGHLLGERDGALRIALDTGGEATVPLPAVVLARQDLEIGAPRGKERR